MRFLRPRFAVPKRATEVLVKSNKKSLENSLHFFVAELLRNSSNALWFHVPNGERRDARTGAKLKRMGVRPGVADFLLILPPHGRVHALELKAPKSGRLSDSQKKFRSEIEDAGGEYAVANTPEEALHHLKEWKVL